MAARAVWLWVNGFIWHVAITAAPFPREDLLRCERTFRRRLFIFSPQHSTWATRFTYLPWACVSTRQQSIDFLDDDADGTYHIHLFKSKIMRIFFQIQNIADTIYFCILWAIVLRMISRLWFNPWIFNHFLCGRKVLRFLCCPNYARIFSRTNSNLTVETRAQIKKKQNHRTENPFINM